MFKVFSDISLALRKELDLETSGSLVLSSGVTGTWVTLNSSNKAVVCPAATYGWPIWNESYRDGTLGQFTPDVVNTKKVSVIVGKVFATTDQYEGTPSIGTALTIGNYGKLAAATLSSHHPVVAYVVKAQYSTTYFGRTINVIDIQTV